MGISEFVEKIASQGRYHFTTGEAARTTGVTLPAARKALGRLNRKGAIATPVRGFHVVVPPEYRRMGCLPPEQFIPQLMEHAGHDYYVGLLSAAEIHGAAHQRPQVFQVVVSTNRPPLRCGDVRVQFVARRNAKDAPTVVTNTPRGHMKVATREMTAFDLVGYARHCGGLGNVATVLAELAEAMAAQALAGAAKLSPIPWAQRLGHLLEIAGAASITEPLAGRVARLAREYVPLNPGRAARRCARSKRWRLILNEDVEPEL